MVMKKKRGFWWWFFFSLVSFILIGLVISFVIMMVRANGVNKIGDKGGSRFVTYNMMFGMYGREGVFNALGHFSFHGIESPFLTRIFSRFNGKTVDIVGDLGADFISLNEVLGTLRKEEIIAGLKEKGYNHFCWGAAAHHDKPLDLGTLFVSKYPFEKLKFVLPQEPHMGGGGGACAVYVGEKNLTILSLHLGLDKELQEKQIKRISDFMGEQIKKKRKVVLMGDFNIDYNQLDVFDSFSKLNLSHANSAGTAPEIDEIKLFEFEAWDNIFYRGLNFVGSGTFKGISDHRGVWADFQS
jgi:endonuclease/exonuclease/phosphatase family metal-dependent hydrolase